MRLRILLLVTLCLCPARTTSAEVNPNEITLTGGIGPILSGQIVKLTGKQRFNDGQLNSLSFYIGTVQPSFQVADADNVLLLVPENLNSGEYDVRVVKHEAEHDIVEFAQRIFIANASESVSASAQASVSQGGGVVQISGVATVELGRNESRPPVSLTLEVVSAPLEQKYFFDDLTKNPDLAWRRLPPIAAEPLYRISSPGRILDSLAVRVFVPPEFLAAIPAGFEPELYAQSFECGADRESHISYESLQGVLNESTGEIVGSLAGDALGTEDCSDTITSTGRVLPKAVTTNYVNIKLAIKATTAPVLGCVRATVNIPASSSTTVSSSDIVNLDALVHMKLPSPLTLPVKAGTGIIRGFHPSNPKKHFGIDFAQGAGLPVYAASNGVVATVAVDTDRPRKPPLSCGGGKVLTTYSRGYYIEIRHSDSNLTRYMHLQNGSATVAQGATVSSGQTIAKSDTTGSTCGAHLHFSYEVCSDFDENTIDPAPWLEPTAPTAQDYLSDWTVVARVNGVAVESTRRVITSQEFAYQAPLSLSGIAGLTAGVKYPLVLAIEDSQQHSFPFFKGTIQLKASVAKILKFVTDTTVTGGVGKAWAQIGVTDLGTGQNWVSPFFSQDPHQELTISVEDGHTYYAGSNYGGSLDVTATVHLRVYLDGVLIDSGTFQWDDWDRTTWVLYPDGPFTHVVWHNDGCTSWGYCSILWWSKF